MNNTKPTPIDSVQVGTIRAAIWKNSTDKGDWFSYTLSRGYKHNGEWKSTSSFSRDNAYELQRVVDLAYDRIVQLEKEHRKQN